MPDSLKVTVPQRRSRTCKLQGPLRPSSLLQRGSPRPDISSWIVQVRQLGLLRSWIFCRLLSEGWKGKDSLNGTLEIQNARLMVRTLTVYCPTICRMCWYLLSHVSPGWIYGVGLGSFHMEGKRMLKGAKNSNHLTKRPWWGRGAVGSHRQFSDLLAGTLSVLISDVTIASYTGHGKRKWLNNFFGV